ncbi:hypothetical protein [Corynebacterium sp. UBA2622]|uniref:hypothetical protein n=1 Tax=Corynebacterium sp. UBA2622 TaxID=1946393 RepID=UPI0025BF1261|nr:hypothetical protein [Corynebacterium sp. UBA2622]
MKINSWLTSGFAARGDEAPSSSNVKDWIVWHPVRVSELTADALQGPLTFYLAPKVSALTTPEFSRDVVLLGIPLGDLEGDWRLNDGGSASATTLDEAASLFDVSRFAHHTDTPNSGSAVEIAGPLTLDKVQIVAGQDRPTTKRALDVFRGMAAPFGERKFYTMPELFPEG